MYNDIVSEATRVATLTVKGKTYPLTMTGDIDQKLSSKAVANGSTVKGWVVGMAEFSEVTGSAPYDKKLGPDMYGQLVAIKGSRGHILRLATDSEDDNPMIVKVIVSGVKITGVNNDGNGESKIEITLLPYEAKYTKDSGANSDKKSTRAQATASDGEDVQTTSSTLAQVLSPSSGFSGSIAGIPISFSI